MADSVKELTPAGNIKRPLYETVVNWINNSQNAIDVNLIQRVFKCCGISNKRDGTEDELIFDYNYLEQSGQSNGRIEQIIQIKEKEMLMIIMIYKKWDDQ